MVDENRTLWYYKNTNLGYLSWCSNGILRPEVIEIGKTQDTRTVDCSILAVNQSMYLL